MQTTFINHHSNYKNLNKPHSFSKPAFANAIFEPLTTNATAGLTLNPEAKTNAFDKLHQRLGELLLWRKGKLLLQALAVVALILPTKSPTHSNQLTNLEKITITKTLKVATTDEHLFENDTHTHGFGYDVATRYANHLGATLDIVSFKDPEDALAALKAGQVDVVISDELFDKTLLAASIGCGDVLGVNSYLLTNPANNALINNAKSYLCQSNSIKETRAMAQFYQKDLLNEYSLNHFNNVLDERLPLYKNTFQSVAKQYNHDWQVLAAISYQESHLNPEAVSRTGVQGIMMLTQDTAKAMGVSDRTNAYESIHGGAKYLDKLNKQFSDIPESDRLWFVLSAYNMGPNAVRNVQSQIEANGKNPNLWSNFYTYLNDNAHKNGRFVQCMHYVTNIRTYLETLKA